jgi:hypothetical protein
MDLWEAANRQYLTTLEMQPGALVNGVSNYNASWMSWCPSTRIKHTYSLSECGI